MNHSLPYAKIDFCNNILPNYQLDILPSALKMQRALQGTEGSKMGTGCVGSHYAFANNLAQIHLAHMRPTTEVMFRKHISYMLCVINPKIIISHSCIWVNCEIKLML